MSGPVRASQQYMEVCSRLHFLKNAFLHKGFIHSSAKNFCEEFHRGIVYGMPGTCSPCWVSLRNLTSSSAMQLPCFSVISFLSYHISEFFLWAWFTKPVAYNSLKMYLILKHVGIYTSSFSGYDVKHKKR